MSPAVTTGLCTLVALAPWWALRAAALRRSAGLAGSVRRSSTQAPMEIGVLLELLAAALRTGAGIPRALESVSAAIGGADGEGLRRAAALLTLGAPWDRAWIDCPRRLDPVRDALRSAWTHGAQGTESLRAAAAEMRQERSARARRAAAALGVRLVLPLGLCFLPAFVLIGLLPLLISLGSGLLGE